MSLLEVLVALAIFIMALAALGQLVQLGLEQAVEADRQTVAARLAQSKMAEVEAGAISVFGDEGNFDDQETLADGTTLWRWEVAGAPTDTSNVYDVTVTVSTTAGYPFSLKLNQLIFDPMYLGTAAPAVAPEDPNAVPEGQ
jgi:type II secretion system protein I